MHILNSEGTYEASQFFKDDTIYPSMFPDFPVELAFAFSENNVAEEFMTYINKRVWKM